MKTVTSIANITWIIAWNLPAILSLIGKIRELFGDEKVQAVLESIKELIVKISPPAPTTDSTGTKPANIEEEKRRRFLRFRNRIKVAESLADFEVQELCASLHVSYHELA